LDTSDWTRFYQSGIRDLHGFQQKEFSDILTRMVNRVTLVGRLGKDPETRYTSGGQAVANFSVATDETYKDRAGERQKRTEWHRIVMWGKLAEIAQQYLKKGALVYLEGRIQSRQWEDKRDGQKKTSYEIVADTMKMLSGRGEGAAAGAGASMGGGSSAGGSRGRGGDDFEPAPMPDEHSGGGEITDEDIPF
jgi:single-strand DNA-binding protein